MTTDHLLSRGFNPVSPVAPRRMIAVISGMDKSGKNHWVFDTAPQPIIVIGLDKGTEGMVEKFVVTIGVVALLCLIDARELGTPDV